MQVVHDDAPEELIEPAKQMAHFHCPVLLYVPATQAIQNSESAVAANWPAMQSLHAVAASELNRPATQVEHSSSPALVELYLPPGQESHA
jgi:hypothetical protein